MGKQQAHELATVVTTMAAGVRTIMLNRPEQMNALYSQVYRDLEAAFDLAETDAECRAVVLTGAGDRAFCAGGDKALDLGNLGSYSVEDSIEEHELAQGVIRRIRDSALPVIARVNGVAVGGGLDLALACDLVIAAESARFGSLWITRGIVPALGGGWLLPRIVGTLKAKELMLTGRLVDGAEAAELGLVTRVVSDADLDAAVDAAVSQILAHPALALRFTKRLANAAAEGALDDYFDAATSYVGLLRSTEEFASSVAAMAARA